MLLLLMVTIAIVAFLSQMGREGAWPILSMAHLECSHVLAGALRVLLQSFLLPKEAQILSHSNPQYDDPLMDCFSRSLITCLAC